MAAYEADKIFRKWTKVYPHLATFASWSNIKDLMVVLDKLKLL